MSRTSVRDQLVTLLKMRGEQTATDLASSLGVTPMAIRQHLQTLQGETWVAYREVHRPMGRPVKLWYLTAQSGHQFPNSHEDLVLDLLGSVVRVYGEAGLHQVIAERQRCQLQNYRQYLAESAPSDWKAIAVAIAHCRDQEGYMAEVLEEPDERLLLVENHCPIGMAAQSCAGLCQAELEIFQTLLGPEVAVERVEHMLGGDRRCAYRLEKRPRCPSGVASHPEAST